MGLGKGKACTAMSSHSLRASTCALDFGHSNNVHTPRIVCTLPHEVLPPLSLSSVVCALFLVPQVVNEFRALVGPDEDPGAWSKLPDTLRARFATLEEVDGADGAAAGAGAGAGA